MKSVAVVSLLALVQGVRLRNDHQENLAQLSDDTLQWDWVTSTYFGTQDQLWPNFKGGTNSTAKCFELDLINTDGDYYKGEKETRFGLDAVKGGRIAVAIPWVKIWKDFGGRERFVASVIEDAQNGGVGNGMCFLAQPIDSYAVDLKIANVSDPAVVPKGITGDQYVYLIVPYQGCGGDSTYGDVVNSCQLAANLDILNANTKEWATQCTNPTEECEAMCSFFDGTTWQPPVSGTPSETAFYKAGSCSIGVSSQSNWGEDPQNAVKANKDMWSSTSRCGPNNLQQQGYANWCSAQNMHFDVAQNYPLIWSSQYTAQQLTPLSPYPDSTNIMMRYAPVHCNIWGSFNPYPGSAACQPP